MATGTLQSSRLISETERNSTCAALEVSIKAQAVRISSLEQAAEAERKMVAQTVARTVSRLFGPPDSDNKALADLRLETARLEAYNDLMASKGCARVVTAGLVKPSAVAQTAGAPTLGPVVPPSGLDLPELERGLNRRGF